MPSTSWKSAFPPAWGWTWHGTRSATSSAASARSSPTRWRCPTWKCIWAPKNANYGDHDEEDGKTFSHNRYDDDSSGGGRRLSLGGQLARRHGRSVGGPDQRQPPAASHGVRGERLQRRRRRTCGLSEGF